HVLDWIERGDVDLGVNTRTGSGARTDGYEIRRAAVTHGIPCLTTRSAGGPAAPAVASARRGREPEVPRVQDLPGIPPADPAVPEEPAQRPPSPDGAGVA